MTKSKTDRKIRAEVYKRKDGLFDVRFVAPNGLLVNSTAQGFSSKGNAKRAIESFEARAKLGFELVDLTKA